MNKSTLLGAGLLSLIYIPTFAQTTTSGTSSTDPANNSAPQSEQQNLNTFTPPPVIIHGAPPASSQDNSGTNTNTNGNSTNPGGASGVGTGVRTNPNAKPTPTPNNNTAPNTTSTMTAPTNPILDCNYHIPAESATVDNNLVLLWAQQAAQQTFSFNPATLDNQMSMLKPCYTDQGWQSFNDALKKSGNLDAITKENLTVSSLLDGQATISPVKDNQWRVIVPIQVVYQNSKEKIMQSLSIHLMITRKVSGDLGIMQIVAMPRQDNKMNPSNTTPPQAPTTVPKQ